MLSSLGRLLVAFMMVGATASLTSAQNVFNPYGNSGYADYREFGSPAYSGNTVLPGEVRLDSKPIITRPRSNSFQDYMDSLEGGETPNRGSSSGLPYFQSFRQYDRQFKREYRPNAEADKGFDERLKRRDEAYMKALEEKDPVKRAALLRQVDRYSLDRPLPKSRTRPGAAASKDATGKEAKDAKAATSPLSRAPNPYFPSSTRRSRAPSPYASPGRSTTASPAGRAPSPPGGSGSVTPRGPSIGLPPDPSTIATPTRP